MSEDAFGAYALYAILLVMLLKEAGIPIPVPSDLIVITAGAQAAVGSFSLLALVLAVEFALIAGGSVQFMAARGPGRALLYRYGRYLGLTPARLDRAASLLRQRGATAVFISLNVPGARAGTIAAAGLAGLSYRTVAPAMILGSTLFYAWHIALGFAIGPAAEDLVKSLSARLAIGVAGLGAVGLVVWLVLRLRRRREAAQEKGEAPAMRAWSEAACPACVASAVLSRLSKRTTADSAGSTDHA